jgi:hypothetical protein
MDKRFLEDCLAKRMSLPQIGRLAGKPAGTVGYWVKKYGLRANGTNTYSPLGGIVEEVLEIMVDDELTLAEMAEQLDCHISTVRYWLGQYGLEATGGRRRRASRQARKSGSRFAVLECRRHGRTRFVLENRGYYRCIKCRSGNVIDWRRRKKQQLVEEAGGKCQICGYHRCMAALEFHHIDPSTKSFPLSMRGCTRSIETLRGEAAKCVLLCANCHAEVENDYAEVPPQAAA